MTIFGLTSFNCNKKFLHMINDAFWEGSGFVGEKVNKRTSVTQGGNLGENVHKQEIRRQILSSGLKRRDEAFKEGKGI